MRPSRILRFAVGFFVALLVIVPSFRFDHALAASLTSLSDALSDAIANATGVTHTVAFTTATTDLVKQVSFQFSTTQGGSTEPAGLDLTSATMGTVSGLGAGWSIDTSSASSGILSITRGSAANVNASTSASVELQSITNSAIDDCQSSNDTLQDTCHVHVTTYSDSGSTEVDSGDTTYTVSEDPFFNFEVEDIPNGQTHNGVTSNIATTATSISFGHIGSGTVRYGTQKLTISTNAPHGYTITAWLFTDWAGDRYVNNNIDPFGAVNATWATPQNWSSPNGSSQSVNSGWFGANTSDTGVSGWSSASGKFGPISQTPHIVSISSGPDRSGSVIYLSYAIEVNGLQAADGYTSELIYDVVPTF